MRSLTCIVLLFTVFSVITVSPAQQASTAAVPQLSSLVAMICPRVLCSTLVRISCLPAKLS